MAQMMKVSYVHTVSYTTEGAEDLAHLLLNGNECKYCHPKMKLLTDIVPVRWT